MEKQEDDGASAPKNPSSPMGSLSNTDSDVSETVLWTHSDSSEDSSDEFNRTATSLLDFRSPTFNPALALKCGPSEMGHIAKGARQYLNLQQYSKAVNSPSKSPRKDVKTVNKMGAHVVKNLTKNDEPVLTKEEPVPSTSSSSAIEPPNFPIPGRRFLPHQMPVYRPRREHPNTITLMYASEVGPMSVLKRVMLEKKRVKIWTRNDKGFRGFLTGFVEAFDKHWNIALRDVDEQFVRKKVIKFPIMGDNISELHDLKEITTQKENELATTTTSATTEGNSNNDDNEDRKKKQAISSTFIRLRNYLRQNDGMTRKQMGSAFTTAAVSTQTNKSKDNRKNSSSSKDPITTTTAATTKSKTVYVGDMDPLSICRTGLANLSLRDDIHHEHQHSQKKEDSSTCSRSSPPPAPSKAKRSTTLMTRPDIIQCHQSKNSARAAAPECFSSSTSSVAAFSPSTCSTQEHSADIVSRTSLKKKSLTVFKTPYEDSFGFMVVAQTRKYELVERHVGQVLLMGNDIVFIETSCSGC